MNFLDQRSFFLKRTLFHALMGKTIICCILGQYRQCKTIRLKIERGDDD